MTAQELADAMKGVVSDATLGPEATRFFDTCSSVGNALGVSWEVAQNTPMAAAAMIVKASVAARLTLMSQVSSLASSRGYVLPDDPSPVISSLNAKRQLWSPIGLSSGDAAALVRSAVELSKVAAGFERGEVSFERPQPSSQISSFDVSVDGISSQSGDPLSDILGYQPDGDAIKRKRALDALAQLDFSKRKPYLLFTADVIVDGRRTGGTIVCWMRMRDASGYLVSRRDIFGATDLPDISLSNDSINASTSALVGENDFHQVISLYDWVHPGDFVAFRDDSTSLNSLYTYSIVGLQRKAPAGTSVFDVPVNNLYLSAAQAADVRALIDADLKTFARGSDEDSISPYPAVSQVVYGDPGYGWILAGCNVLSSIRRGDVPDRIRSFSFIGSKVDDILSSAASGLLVAPNDISSVHSAVDSSILSFGVSQTVLLILDGTGSTLFISGKDDPSGLGSPTKESLEDATGGLAKILATIDPQTATIDPAKLISTLSSNPSTANPQGVRYAPIQMINSSTVQVIPDLSSVVGTGAIDLTTYDGISRLMDLLRSVYDFYPSSLG